MTLKTLKTKTNISLILDDEFIQFCKLNKIEDIEKTARETFKRGFDLLKYGNIPMGEISSQDREKVVPEPPKRTISSVPPEDLEKLNEGHNSKPEIIEAVPLKSSDGKEAFTKMGVVTKKKDEKKDLYGE